MATANLKMNFVTRSFNRPKYATLSFCIYGRDKEEDKKTAYAAKMGTMGAVRYTCQYCFNDITTKLLRRCTCKRDSND